MDKVDRTDLKMDLKMDLQVVPLVDKAGKMDLRVDLQVGKNKDDTYSTVACFDLTTGNPVHLASDENFQWYAPNEHPEHMSRPHDRCAIDTATRAH